MAILDDYWPILFGLTRPGPPPAGSRKEALFWLDRALRVIRARKGLPLAVTLRSHSLSLAWAMERRGWDVPQRAVLEAYAFPDRFQFKIGKRSDYEFSQDLFSQRIPSWRKDLGPMLRRKNNQLLEIGSFEGFSACWLAEHGLHGRNATLTCVDPFLRAYSAVFRRNVRKTGKSAQIRMKRGRSRDVLPRLKSGAYDFVYVDGDHSTRGALWDARQAWRLLKPGGILVVDDYDLFDLRRRDYPVKKAVTLFLRRLKKNEMLLIRKGAQIVIRKEKAA